MQFSLPDAAVSFAVVISVGIFGNGMKDLYVHSHGPVAENKAVNAELRTLGLTSLPAGYSAMTVLHSLPGQSSLVLVSPSQVLITITDSKGARAHTKSQHTLHGATCTHSSDQKISTRFGDAITNISSCDIGGRTLQEETATLNERRATNASRKIFIRSTGTELDDTAFREIVRDLNPSSSTSKRS